MFINIFHLDIMENKIISKLLKYKSSGNYFLLYFIIKENSKKGICSLTQEELAKKIKKTRQFVSKGLKVLSDNKIIEFSYREIKVLND